MRGMESITEFVLNTGSTKNKKIFFVETFLIRDASISYEKESEK